MATYATTGCRRCMFVVIAPVHDLRLAADLLAEHYLASVRGLTKGARRAQG